MTWTIWTNFHSPIPRRLHIKFGFNRLSGYWGKYVWKYWIWLTWTKVSEWPWPLVLIKLQLTSSTNFDIIAYNSFWKIHSHVTWTIWTNFRYPIPRGFTWNLAPIDPVVSEEMPHLKMLTTYIHTYGRQRPTCAINSLMNLRLRWAKMQ